MALWAASACRARRCRHHLLPAAGPCAYLPDAAARTARGKEACAWSLRHSGTAWFGEGPAPSAAAQRRGQSRYSYPGRTVRGRTRNLAGAPAGSRADAPTTSRIHQPGDARRSDMRARTQVIRGNPGRAVRRPITIWTAPRRKRGRRGRPRLLAGHRRRVVRRAIDVSWEICEYFLSARVTWIREQCKELSFSKDLECRLS